MLILISEEDILIQRYDHMRYRSNGEHRWLNWEETAISEGKTCTRESA